MQNYFQTCYRGYGYLARDVNREDEEAEDKENAEDEEEKEEEEEDEQTGKVRSMSNMVRCREQEKRKRCGEDV